LNGVIGLGRVCFAGGEGIHPALAPIGPQRAKQEYFLVKWIICFLLFHFSNLVSDYISI
jgi:hypothetical protein